MRVFRQLLRVNGLTGTIPESLGQLDSLKFLDLRSNQLTGPIPDALGQLNNLKDLYLSWNELTGCIPSALQAVPYTDLDDLGIAFCHLESGEAAILAAFYEATGGDHWKNNTNWLSGAPLSEWYGITTDDEGWVTALDLSGNVGLLYGDYPSGNGLTGTIPKALGQLDNLESLDFSDNELTGPIPETLGQLNNLRFLNLSGNQLTGPIPETLGQLNNLEYLYLSWNELTGCIPPALRDVPDNDLHALGLSSCQ